MIGPTAKSGRPCASLRRNPRIREDVGQGAHISLELPLPVSSSSRQQHILACCFSDALRGAAASPRPDGLCLGHVVDERDSLFGDDHIDHGLERLFQCLETNRNPARCVIYWTHRVATADNIDIYSRERGGRCGRFLDSLQGFLRARDSAPVFFQDPRLLKTMAAALSATQMPQPSSFARSKVRLAPPVRITHSRCTRFDTSVCACRTRVLMPRTTF